MRFLELTWNILPKLLGGTVITIELTIIAITTGVLLGIPVALGRVYGSKLVYTISTFFVEIIRGTPLLTQLFILYFGLPSVGIMLSPLVAAMIGMGINSAAYQAEYFRGAIQAIRKEQLIAAYSLGMKQIQVIKHIVLPQMFRLAIPSWSNELIYLLKYSSMAYMIQAPEIMSQGRLIASRNFRTFEVFIVVALIYLILVLVLSKLLDLMEKRFHIPGL
ncbi:MAG: amino acid ABC transporter permease [Atribacterota bacterium]|nr:amino acid ABC transporter permease [Atribacterota bacterium]MDD4895241.1 amino acid ABC transporter permease [Atribacterota bacterium]MDD5636997.1 amino acid ABC transporter permease [Atribacterota bacterium]